MSENKKGKYIKYAIGEIVLVVIGILIALSINNWNENRKLDIYERKMLREIYASLKADHLMCQNMLAGLNRMEIANDSIIKFLKNDTGDLTTVRGYFTTTALSSNLDFKLSAYESLKSRGLDIISNDSLRKSLSNLYDFRYPYSLYLVSNYNIHLRNEWRPFMIDNFQFNIEGNDDEIIRRPLYWDKLKSNPKMRNILILNRYLIIGQKDNLKEIINELEIILKFIDAENQYK